MTDQISIAEKALMMLFLFLFAYINASDFDATEWQMILEFGVVMVVLEFIKRSITKDKK